MALAVENIVSNKATGTATPTVDITTSGTDRIVVIVAHAEKTTASPTISSVSAAGLTFQKHTSQQWAASHTDEYNGYEVWWAYAASVQTANTVTITWDATIDDSTVMAFAVSGSTAFTDPFDANASVPSLSTGSAATPSDSGLSTDSTNTILFNFCATGDGLGIPSAPSGHTSMGSQTNNGGTRWSAQSGSYIAFASTQSGYSFTDNGTTDAIWGLIVFVIRDSAPPTTQTYTYTVVIG